MRLLILGGTQFVGRHITETALANGHEVTLFNRGKTNPELFPQVEKIVGYRDGDLSGLVGKSWDAVIDVNGYLPRVVRQSAEFLRDSVGHYVFVSTISVYEDLSQPHTTEDSPLATLSDPLVEEITGETYGGLKVLCEQAVQEVFPDQSLIIRPGLVAGMYDHTYRFGYWVDRATRGGKMLVPESPEYPLQVIDGKDLAAFILQHTESGTSDVFHCTSPAQQFSLGQVVEVAKSMASADTEFLWMPPEFIIEYEITPGAQLPLYFPADYRNAHLVDTSKAIRAGLKTTPLEETIKDTLAWEQSDSAHKAEKPALSAHREQELIALWHA